MKLSRVSNLCRVSARLKAEREFTGDGGHSISSHLPAYITSSVSGDMPTAKRERVMTAFKQADRAVLSNARCLTEGARTKRTLYPLSWQ